MARVLNVARFPGGGIPDIQSMEYKADESIVKGSVLIYNSGQVALASSPVSTGVVGVALEDIASKPGLGMSHDSQVTERTGNVAEVSVAMANTTIIWSVAAVTGVAPAVSHIGTQRPVALSGGVWQVDLSSSSNKTVIVVDVDVLEAIVFFKWMAAALDTA